MYIDKHAIKTLHSVYNSTMTKQQAHPINQHNNLNFNTTIYTAMQFILLNHPDSQEQC